MSAKEWQMVDELWRAGRGNLADDDLCFFYYVRDNRGWSASHDNDEMWDLKHDPVKHPPGTPAYAHKMKAIEGCAAHLADLMRANEETFYGLHVMLVPIPPSVPREDPSYDDRMERICGIVSESVPWVSVENAISTVSAVQKSHLGGTRDANEIYENIRCSRIRNGALSQVAVLVDDVLTTGAHYAACKRRLTEANPGMGLVMGAFMSIYVRSGDHGYGTSSRDR